MRRNFHGGKHYHIQRIISFGTQLL